MRVGEPNPKRIFVLGIGTWAYRFGVGPKPELILPEPLLLCRFLL